MGTRNNAEHINSLPESHPRPIREGLRALGGAHGTFRGEWQCDQRGRRAQGASGSALGAPRAEWKCGSHYRSAVNVRGGTPRAEWQWGWCLVGRPLGLWAPHRHRDAPLSLPETTLSRRRISLCSKGVLRARGPVADRGTRCRQGAFPAGQAACPASHKRRDRTRYGVGTAPAPYERVGMPARLLPASPSR